MRKAIYLIILGSSVAFPVTAQLLFGVAKDSDNRSWGRQFQLLDAENSGLSLSPAGGDVVLSFPIPLPRGAGGLTPTLSLDYDSGDLSNGPIGVGWALGFPRIETRNLPGVGTVTDLVIGNRRSRLIDIGSHARGHLFASHMKPAGPFFFYRSEGDYWGVADAEGTEWVFGRHPSLRQATGKSLRSWYLEEATDSFKNRILASYSRSGDELLLHRIGYVERDPAAMGTRSVDGTVENLCEAYLYCVELEWAPRPDPLVGAHGGQVFWLLHRLERISLKSAAVLRLGWLLLYAPEGTPGPGRTERSVLVEIKRRGHGTDGTQDETLFKIETPAFAERWKRSAWPGMPPPFPNGLSTVADFNGDGRSDVMGVLPYGRHANTWVFTRSEGTRWFDVVGKGTVDPERVRKIAWAPGPYRMIPIPLWAFFKDGDPCQPSIFNSPVWELPPAGSMIVGDYDANGLPDIAYALPTVPVPPSETVTWEMFLSSGDGWLGSSRDNPVPLRWKSGPFADTPDVDCRVPRRFSLGVYCRAGRFDPDERDDVSCYLPHRKLWQVGHAGTDDWNVEEVDASAFAPTLAAAPAWGEDCLAADLDGDGIDEIACPSRSRTALEVLRRTEAGQWTHETWPVEMPVGAEALAGCFPASLNEDTLADIICATSKPGQWLLSISDGQRFRAGSMSSGVNTSDPHEQCFAADMDNDSRTDLVCLRKAPNQFSVSYTRGLTLSSPEAFQPAIPRSSSSEPGWCRFGDFNGDTALDVACVASDFGASIVTQLTAPVPDEIRGYRSALGATTRLEFAPAADEEISPPVIRRRYLKSIEVDPGAGQPVLRKTFSYGGGHLGELRAPIMTFSAVTETSFDISAEGARHLATNLAEYTAWRGGADLPQPVLTSWSRLDSAGCPLERRDFQYKEAVNVLPGAPLLVSLRDWGTVRSSESSCPALVEAREQRLEYDGQDRVSCTMAKSGLEARCQFSCAAYESGSVVPSSLLDRSPRVIRTGLFEACGPEETIEGDGCRPGADYVELAASISAPKAVRVLERRRLDFDRSLPPCEQGDARPRWTSEPLAVYLVDESGEERSFRQASFDGHGNLICEGLPGGAHQRLEWHPLGHASTSVCDFSGDSCWTFEHSGSSDTGDSSLPPGLLTRVSKPWGSSTSFMFDMLGRLTGASDGDRGLTSLEMTDLGNPDRQKLKATLPSGEEVETRFDGLGRVVATIHRPLLGLPSLRQAKHDGLSRITGSTTPYFQGDDSLHWTRLVYDDLGRLTQVLNPDGSREELSHGLHEVTHRDALGVATRFLRRHDSDAGEQLEIERVSAPARLIGRYTLDGLGRTTSAADASGVLARWNFNSFGDLLEQWEKAIGSTTFTYDNFGRPSTSRDPRGVTSLWNYDSIGRPTRRSIGRWPNRYYQDFQYDDSRTGLGRLLRASNRWTHYTWTYDGSARIQSVRLRERWPFGGRTASISYSFDDLSRIESITLPDERKIGFEYHGNRVGSIIDTRTGDPIVTYREYDEYGLPSLEMLGDGTRVARQRDNVGRLETIELDGKSLSHGFEFAYTPTGNLHQVSRDGTPVLAVFFDEEGRIARLLAAPSTERSFSYDQLANVETVSPGPRLEYGMGSEHPHAVSRVEGESVRNDELMRARHFGSAFLRYRQGSSKVSHGWRLWRNEEVQRDAAGLPYSLRSAQGDVTRAFGLWQKDGRGCHVGVPTPFGVAAISRCGSSSYEFLHLGPGAVFLGVARRAGGGLVLADGTLDPYLPLPRRELEALLKPTTFTFRDGVLQLQGERMLVPSIGRFLQRDPLYPPDSSYFELNRYAFALGNPLRFADPDGLQSYEMSMTAGWPTGQIASFGHMGSPIFNSVLTPSFRMDLPRLSTLDVRFDTPTGPTATQQSVGPTNQGRQVSILSYKGEPVINLNFDYDVAVGPSFGKGPTMSLRDGSFSQEIGFGFLFTEVNTKGTASVGASAGLGFRAGTWKISLLEAGPILRYASETSDLALGAQGRVLGVTFEGTVSASFGSGLIRFYQDLENALTPIRCGLGCAWFP